MQPINTAQTFSSKQEAKMYLNAKLNEYAKIVAKLAQNPEMQKLVNKKVAERFDDDYNVLLKNLTNRPTTEKFSLKKVLQMSTTPINEQSPMQQQLDLGELEAALIEPLTINGQVLYPQIYIPFFEEQENFSEPIEPSEPGDPTDPNPCLNAVINPLEPLYLNPVIVPYDGQEVSGQDTFMGSTYDQNGVLIENIPVDECFAKRHRVWAITLNERVNSLGATPPTFSGPTPTTPTIQKPVAFIPTMTIKTHKEQWIKGASEICMKYAFSWENLNNPTTGNKEITYFIDNYYRTVSSGYSGGITNFPDGSYDKIPIRTFTIKEINKRKEINIDFIYAPLTRASYFPEKGDYLYFVIYEEDAGFWDMLEGYDTVNSHGVTFQILTDDDPYLLGRIKIVAKDMVDNSGINLGNFNIDSDVIKFSSRYK